MRSNLVEQKRTKIDADGTVVNLRIGHYEIVRFILREGWEEDGGGERKFFFIKPSAYFSRSHKKKPENSSEAVSHVDLVILK